MLLRFENEAAWLEARKRDVTSTDVAAMLGLSPYKSRLSLWMEKAGVIEPDDLDDNPFALWGRRLQRPVAIGICEDEGWGAQDLTGLYLRDPESRLGASMDAKASGGDRGNILLEIKTTGYFGEDSGWFKDVAPIHIEFQIQTQLHLAIKDGQDIQCGCIGALSGRKETRLYFREHDAALGAMIEEEAKKFWRSIELKEPPAPDYAVDGDLIRRLQGPVDLGGT